MTPQQLEPLISKHSSNRSGRSLGQKLVIFLGLVVFVAAIAGVFGLNLVQSQASQIPRVTVGSWLDIDVNTAELKAQEEKQVSSAKNFLLVGIDSAVGIDPDSPIHIDRDINTLLTDSVVLVRVDPEADRVAMLSIPRDLWVPIAGKNRSGRVNTARGLGGPATLIETISDYLGVPIHHYVEINFAGFLRVVDAVGGVPVEISQPIRDDSLGLRIEQTGVVTLDPDTALAYVRTRRPLTLVAGGNPANDSDWVRLGVWNDLERNQRQQDFMVATLKRAVGQGMRNPLTLRRVTQELLDDGSPSIVLDDIITLGQLIALGDQFRSFSVEQIERYELVVSDAVIDAKQVLLLVEQSPGLQTVLDLFGAGSLASIQVRVLNGTAVRTVDQIETQLQQAGFSVVERSNAASFDVSQTIIRYSASAHSQALVLAQYIEPTPLLVLVSEDALVSAGAGEGLYGALTQVDLELVVGANFGAVKSAVSAKR